MPPKKTRIELNKIKDKLKNEIKKENYTCHPMSKICPSRVAPIWKAVGVIFKVKKTDFDPSTHPDSLTNDYQLVVPFQYRKRYGTTKKNGTGTLSTGTDPVLVCSKTS